MLEQLEAEEAASMRRKERLKQIPELLAQENTLIMELSSSLSDLQKKVKGASGGHKSPKHQVFAPVDESQFVDVNLQFLLACKFKANETAFILFVE